MNPSTEGDKTNLFGMTCFYKHQVVEKNSKKTFGVYGGEEEEKFSGGTRRRRKKAICLH